MCMCVQVHVCALYILYRQVVVLCFPTSLTLCFTIAFEYVSHQRSMLILVSGMAANQGSRPFCHP